MLSFVLLQRPRACLTVKQTMREPVTHWMMSRTLGDVEATSHEGRSRLGLLEGYVSLVLNAVLALIKGVLGFLTGSVSLIADAVHTLSDCLSSIVLVVGAYLSRQPPDEDHPFGHGRVEYISAMVIGILLGVAAVEFGKESVYRMMEPKVVQAPLWTILVVLASVLVKIWNSLFASILAKKSGSTSIDADFWHHMTDVLTTLLAVVGMLSASIGIPWLDGAMGLAVCIVLLWAAYHIAKESISPLLGQAPSHEELKEIVDRAMNVEHVLGVHDVVVHHYGALRLVSLHVEVSDNLSPVFTHNIAELVQDAVDQTHGTVVVHIDPISSDHPLYEVLTKGLDEVAKDHEIIDSYHELRIIGDANEYSLVCDVNLVVEPTPELTKELRQHTIQAMRERFPGLRDVTLNAEPLFVYSARMAKEG